MPIKPDYIFKNDLLKRLGEKYIYNTWYVHVFILFIKAEYINKCSEFKMLSYKYAHLIVKLDHLKIAHYITLCNHHTKYVQHNVS